ncbi:AraC family transcriptional regulator [Chitinophaga sp. GCM10012297]|uniref:Helix-turn-helix domain-containing protein n=1 Tax=Chitinophaga chungangae TaxID=2821488 RepID=A0ABS3Y9N7_9BACT|nr:helix-turn-helix transcriptional regulator [Chitinophaga chungangae]MBO9151346.1 helix-turn-helix domain-containing protein [Chitinophaga chungangae]
MNTIPVKSKISAESLFKISMMKTVIKPTSPHRHADYHEFVFLDAGSGFHDINGVSFEVTPAAAFYIRPGQTHCWNFSALPKGYVLLFREELLLKEDLGILFDLPAHIPLKEQPALFRLLTDLHEEYKVAAAGDAVYSAYLHLLIAKLKQLSRTKNNVLTFSDGIFQQYKRLVNDNFPGHRQLKFYVEKLNTTTGTLNEICKRSGGKTASAVINERVLLEAKMLLSATVSPVKEIAAALKFSDAPHFVKFFKLYTNLTPGQYREMALSKK